MYNNCIRGRFYLEMAARIIFCLHNRLLDILLIDIFSFALDVILRIEILIVEFV